MTLKQRRNWGWSVGAIITLAGIIWTASAWAADNDALDCAQTEQISTANAKAVESLTIAVENRTRATIMEARVLQLEERMDRLESMSEMVSEIYEIVVMRGGE
jgi:hypothetical protein